jgi:phospholipase A-2-activating protein
MSHLLILNPHQMHEGHLYDHVIDVDVSENSPPLKLAFNSEDDPREVAEAFLLSHGLPSSYREQIVEFIRRNTALNFNASGSVTGGFCDPFTGGGGGGGGGVQGQSSRSGLSHVPATKYLAFDTPINCEGLRKKLKEFDALVGSDASTVHLSLGLGNNEGDASVSLETLLKKLPGSVIPNGIDKSMSFTSQDLALLEKLLSWPAAYLFPAIDATRALILDAGAVKLLSSSPSALSRVISALDSTSTSMDPKAASVNQQLALRVASNAFKHPETRDWVVGQGVRDRLFESCPVCCTPQSSKAVRLSMATLLHNMSILFKGPSTIDESAAEAKVQVFSALVDLLGSSVGPGQEEMSEVAYTGLVALGTILYEDKELTALARDVGVNEVIKKIHADPATKQPSGNKVKLLQAAVDITRLMG